MSDIASAAITAMQTEIAAAKREAFEEAAKMAEELYDDAPSAPYDNGGTQDGWQCACSKLADDIRALKGGAK